MCCDVTFMHFVHMIIDITNQLLNVLACNMQCCSPEVGMLPEASYTEEF